MLNRLDSFIKSNIFPRPKESTYDALSHKGKLLHIPQVDIQSTAENGDFNYAYLLKPSCDFTFLMIYAHPNAVDIGMSYDELSYVSKHSGIAILLFEYLGYGLTHAEITENTILTDMHSAYWFARRRLGVPPERIVLCGRSIGCAPAAHLAAHLPLSAAPSLLVLQCPFSSLSECIRDLSQNAVSITNFRGFNWFRTIDLIADVPCPVVLQHGTFDTNINVSHTYDLKAKRDLSPHPRVTYLYIEEGKGHNNLSRNLLVTILKEKLDGTNLKPIKFLDYGKFKVQQSLFSTLFDLSAPAMTAAAVSSATGTPLANAATSTTSSTISPVTCMETIAFWEQQSWRIRDYVFKRERLHVLLTMSMCYFAMKCTLHWQLYCHLHKVHTASEAPPLQIGDRRCSMSAFVLSCCARWGSPLGIHILLDKTHTHPLDLMVVFGCFVGQQDLEYMDAPITIADTTYSAPLTVAELAFTPSMIKAVQRVISSAPALDALESMPCFIQAELVELVQLECERAVALLSDADWLRLSRFFASPAPGIKSFLSSKASQVMESFSSFLASSEKETLEDMEEWLRPWCGPQHATSAELTVEMPWDYYLLKARRCDVTIPLNKFSDVPDFEAAVRKTRLALAMYDLFQRYSRQVLQPCFLSSTL